MTSKITKKIIKELNEDPILFITSYDSKLLFDIITYATDKYFNDQPIISDEVYDFLYDTMRDLEPDNPALKKIGAKIKKVKVKLPYFMGSMDKIKPTDQNILNKWLKTYKGDYVFSDKLDGVSGLLIKQETLKLFTRGDGIEGTDISHLIPYINTFKNIKLSEGVAVRGELIMSKANFIKYEDKMANARNMVSGIVNSKKIDPKVVSDIDFVVYELINPWNKKQSEQWKILNEYNFKVVPNGKVIDVQFNKLSEILIKRKELSEYEIDGIIVSNNILNERSNEGNPDYAFAFKDANLSDKAEVEVLDVEWNISKDKYIKPILKIVPTKLSGVVISNITAYNAKYIVDNKLGPGSIIELIRSGDVIPKVQKVIKPTKAKLPDIEYEWTTTGVDIIATEGGIEQQIKELTFFFKKLDIANIDESTVKKMLDVGINSIEEILKISKEKLYEIEGFKDKMVDKIYNNIRERIETLTMLDIMVASNTFGHGIGERKLKKIMEVYPDIIKLYSNYSKEEIINKIIKIEGYDTKTAEYFAEGLDNFINLFNRLEPNIRKKLRTSQIINEEVGDKFKGKTIVFSGFRNKEWEKIIEENGGKIGSSISSKTSMLITTKQEKDEATNSKVKKANELKIQILTKEEFEQKYLN